MASYDGQIAFADLCDEMQSATDELGLQSAMGRFVHRNGFEWFGYVARSSAESYGHSSYPTAWEALYVEREYYEIDPVLRAAQKMALPFRWGEAADIGPGSHRAFFGVAADFNVRQGLTIPIAGTFGSFAALSLAGSHNDNRTEKFDENLPLMTLAALHYHLQFARVRDLFASGSAAPASQLSARSKICLTWVARGKTIEEIAEILNIHEATVRFHLNEARRRLNASSLPQLVAEALKRGEIVY